MPTAEPASLTPASRGDVIVRDIPISELRRDGDTQCRARLDERTIRDYQSKFEAGVSFPPVTVWFDGTHLWLSDGFQRVLACERCGKTHITAEIRYGTQSDAQWDSYRCNSAHGLPRTKRDIDVALSRALNHARSKHMSTAELAKYLQLPEATVRRWRKRLSSSSDEDSVRIVRRRGTTYAMNITGIGRHTSAHTVSQNIHTVTDAASALRQMEDAASPQARRLLAIIANWLRGGSHVDCLAAIEHILSTPSSRQ